METILIMCTCSGIIVQYRMTTRSTSERSHEFTPGFLVGFVLLIFLVFCVVLLCSEFRVVMFVTISAMFGSSLTPVVCRRAHV